MQKVVPQQHWVLIAAGDHAWPIVSSVFVNARLIGLSDDWAWVVQAVSSCCALAAVIWTYWRRRDPVLSSALLVTATFLFSPWMLNYDMVVFVWVVALLRAREDETYVDHGLALAVWALPVLMLHVRLLAFPDRAAGAAALCRAARLATGPRRAAWPGPFGPGRRGASVDIP